MIKKIIRLMAINRREYGGDRENHSLWEEPKSQANPPGSLDASL